MLGFPASWTHRGFAFNAHLYADGTPDEAYVHATVTIDERRILTGYRDLREPLHLAQGGTLGRVHKNMTLIQLVGRIQVADATQAASISDRERELLVAFDPYLCYLDSPSTDGAYALDFSEATLDTTNYPSGIVLLRYYCRPTERPLMSEHLNERGWRNYSLALVAPDPRCYEQSSGSLVLTPGSPSGNIINRGSVPGPLRATILMAGSGAANFTITVGGVALVLNLAGLAAGQTCVVTMETCGPYGRGRRVVAPAGTEAFSRKTSGAATWLTAPAGTTAASIANTTNVASCTLEWKHSRP